MTPLEKPPPSAPPARGGWRVLLVGAGLGFALLVAWWWQRPDGLLHVWLLDTPGDAILIQMPQGEVVLLDGGSDPAALALHLGEKLPFWRRRLDALILSDNDPARLPGQIGALQHYHADLLLYAAPLPTDDAEAQAWATLLATTPAIVPQMGERLAFGGATLTVLDNGAGMRDSGLVLQLDHGSTRVVLAGSMGEQRIPYLLEHAAPATLLVYPWAVVLDHGLMQAWQPQAIAYSRTRRSPAAPQITLAQRAALSGTPITRQYTRTLHGTIELLSNGRDACIVTTRCPAYQQWQAACHASNQHCRQLLRVVQ